MREYNTIFRMMKTVCSIVCVLGMTWEWSKLIIFSSFAFFVLFVATSDHIYSVERARTPKLNHSQCETGRAVHHGRVMAMI